MVGFSLGGSRSSSSTNESGTSKSTTTGNESSKQLTQRLDADSIDNLTAVLNSIAGNLTGGKEYSKEAALQDSKGIVQQLFTEFSQSVLPQVIGKATQSGAYNSTASKLLADNLFAQTAQKAAEVQLGAITSYAQAAANKQQVQTQTLGTILQGLLQAKETTSLDTLLNSTTNSSYSGTSKTKSKGLSGSAGFSLGG